MKYNLEGVDGNAFVVMGYVTKAMKREGKTEAEINLYRNMAKAGDYDNLLMVSFDMVENLNEKYNN